MTPMGRVTLAMLLIGGFLSPAAGGSPFATRVIDYDPAPGQFVNVSPFDDPNQALGPPEGAGVREGNAVSVVSLGGFGGSITLAFDHLVEDQPLNPFGLDAIVFGNAFYREDAFFNPDPNRRWAECATIEIAWDANGNGLADDRWYLIPGSHLPDPAGRYTVVTWDDDPDDPTYPPSDEAFIPPGRSGVWTTEGFLLPAGVFGVPLVENPAASEGQEGIFGYADYTPTLQLGDLNADDEIDDPALSAEVFYTVPDDPFRVGLTEGSGGGDSFDIAWAIDPVSGEPAGLRGFHFIRITNAVNASFPEILVLEVSTEIDAVADVAVDAFGDHDADEDIDVADVAVLFVCFSPGEPVEAACTAFDRLGDSEVDRLDAIRVLGRLTGPRP